MKSSLRMRGLLWLVVGFIALSASAQKRPYIGFVYPAGGQQGTTFQVKIGGQGLEDVDRVYFTGPGISARVLEYHRQLSPQDMTLLREQHSDLKQAAKKGTKTGTKSEDASSLALRTRIEQRMANYVNRPACASIANIAIIEVTLARNAPLFARELRLGTPSGISNPMVFQVGPFEEFSRSPMKTCEVQVLGKEELALRKRPPGEDEMKIKLPCTVNGQIASGAVDRYRFAARKGQKLVISAQARQLIPFIADAVPGWFQPVLRLTDGEGREVAYVDDFRFKPDPMIIYEVPKDGDYVFSIYDSIYRGREDFVYRITAGEMPYVTGIFPLGARVGETVPIKMSGINLEDAKISTPPRNTPAGIYSLAPSKGSDLLNLIPFALDTLPEASEQEPNDSQDQAQKVTTPVTINGRIQKPGDADVFQFSGRKEQTIVAEVYARRLDSPLDSILALLDSTGKVLAYNDDLEDAGSGVNTHHADSYLQFTLPADGTYYLRLGDTTQSGGEEYAYRLRISPPRPDFALRVVPSSISIRGKGSANLSVHVIRRDGFTGPITVGLKNPPKGFSASPVTFRGTQEVANVNVKVDWKPPAEPVSLNLIVQGQAKIQEWDVIHDAVPAEDRMQAFLWRHLVPASELKVEVSNAGYKPPPRRVPSARAVANVQASVAAASEGSENRKFTKSQVSGRLRDLKLLYEEGLLTDEFYLIKVAECAAAK